MGTLGQRLIECRKASKLNQTAAARKVGMSQANLSELERDFYPTSSFIPALAKLYGVDSLWLATGNGEKLLKSARSIDISATAMSIAMLINEEPPEYQEAILHMLEVNKQKRDGIKLLVDPEDSN